MLQFRALPIRSISNDDWPRRLKDLEHLAQGYRPFPDQGAPQAVPLHARKTGHLGIRFSTLADRPLEQTQQHQSLSMGSCVACHRESNRQGVNGMAVQASLDCVSCHR